MSWQKGIGADKLITLCAPDIWKDSCNSHAIENRGKNHTDVGLVTKALKGSKKETPKLAILCAISKGRISLWGGPETKVCLLGH